MANNKKNYYKNRNYPSKKMVENNSSVSNSKNNTIHEFNTYRSRQTYSSFGFNVLDLYSQDQWMSLVRDPMNNNKLLREISLRLYGTNGVLRNTVDYLVAMPTLDKAIVSHGNSPQKKRKNEQLMETTLRQIKHKEIVRDILWKGFVEGVAFYYFETSKRPIDNKKYMSDYEVDSVVEVNESQGDIIELNVLNENVSLIALPADYTEIVQIKNSSYVLAFNLDYFLNFSGEDVENKLRKYPKEIRDAYHERFNGKDGFETNNWVKLDNSKTITYKIGSKRDEKYGRPLVLAAINDILYSDYFTQTKRNTLDELNNRIIYQTFPEGKEKGTSALTKQQQDAQHNAVKGAIMTKNNRGGVSVFSIAAGTKIQALDIAKTDIFDDKYESNLNNRIALDLGIAASLLNGVGSGSYSAQELNLELITAQLFQYIEQIESELNKCISENIIKDPINWVDCRYLHITNVNKKEMVQNAKELYTQGRGSLILWASAAGFDADVFFALLDKEKEMDIENKYPVHMTSYVLSKNDQATSGRPKTDNPSEKTIASRNNNGNALPSPSDRK